MQIQGQEFPQELSKWVIKPRSKWDKKHTSFLECYIQFVWKLKKIQDMFPWVKVKQT